MTNKQLIKNAGLDLTDKMLKYYLEIADCTRGFGYEIKWSDFVKFTKAEEKFTTIKRNDFEDDDAYYDAVFDAMEEHVKIFNPGDKNGLTMSLIEPGSDCENGTFTPEEHWVEIRSSNWSNYFHEALKWNNDAH